MRNKIIFSVMAVVALILLPFMHSFPAAAAEIKEPVVIGLFTHLSGPFAEHGIGFKNAVTLQIDKVNAAGGLEGHPVKLIVEDDRNSPQEAAAVARKIVETPGVVLSIGSWSTSASIAAAPIFIEAKIPQISPTASHPDFTKPSVFLFRQNNTDDILAEYNARTIAEQLKAKRIVVPYSQDDWGVYTGPHTAEAIKKLGSEVVLLEAIIPGTKDFRPLVSKIKNLNPDGIFLALLSYQDASILMQQLYQAGVNISAGGGIPLSSSKFIELGGKAVEGTVLHTTFFPGDPRKKDFVDLYYKTYGKTPDQFTALAYDAAGVGLAAIDRVLKSGKPLTGSSVRDELASGPAYTGVTGVTKYDANRNVKKDPTFIIIKNGTHELFRP